MFYTPGPKARAEHHAFAKSGRMIDALPESERSANRRRAAPTETPDGSAAETIFL
jgi:hypothetical protein